MTDVDMLGKPCDNCHTGFYQEYDLNDDWDGTVTCLKCRYQVRRHPTLDTATKIAYHRCMDNWNYGPIPADVHRVIGYSSYYGINFVRRGQDWRGFRTWDAEVSRGHGEGAATMGDAFPWMPVPVKPVDISNPSM